MTSLSVIDSIPNSSVNLYTTQHKKLYKKSLLLKIENYCVIYLSEVLQMLHVKVHGVAIFWPV